MPIYEFKCNKCGQRYESVWRTPIDTICQTEGSELIVCQDDCPDEYRYFENGICGGRIKRVFSFSIRRSMPEHFNNSTGTYVSNERALKDDFKRLSDAATERTGILHNYVPIDPQDKETLGVTDEGLDSTHDGMVKRGEKDETSPRKVIKLG